MKLRAMIIFLFNPIVGHRENMLVSVLYYLISEIRERHNEMLIVMDGWIEGQMDRSADGWIEGQMDCWKDGWRDRGADGLLER